MNRLIQRGNLGGSPVLKTAGDVVYARFSYAVNVLDRDGNRTPQWWSAVAFGKLAQTLAKLQKGDEILVEGEPRESRYTKDGVNHRVFEVRVQRVEFLRLKPRENGEPAAPPQDDAHDPDGGDDGPSNLDPEPDPHSEFQPEPEPHPDNEPPSDPEAATPDQERPRSRWRRHAA